MPKLHIPAGLRRLTGGLATVDVDGDTLAAAIDALDAAHPGIRARLLSDAEAGAAPRLRSGLAAFVDGAQVSAATGLSSRLADTSEVYFVPAVAGG